MSRRFGLALLACLFTCLLATHAFAERYYTIDWDWEASDIVTSNGQQYFLPWVIGSSNQVPQEISIDHKSADGWVLLWSNFDGHIVDSQGIPISVTEQHPFFALYNKYRGIVRFFYLHRQTMTSTDMMYALTFEGIGSGSLPGGTTSLLNYSYEFASPLDEPMYRPFVSQASFSQFGVSGPVVGHWYFYEAELSYDDVVASLDVDNLILRWMAKGVNTQSLTVSGYQQGTIDGRIEVAGSDTPFFSVGTLFDIDSSSSVEITNSINANGDGSSTVDSKGDSQLSSLLKNKLKSLATSLLSSAADLLSGGLTDILSGFIGGGEAEAPTQNVNLRIQTEIDLSGTITQEFLYFNRSLKVPGTSLAGSTASVIVPLYDQPLGLIAVTGRPALIWDEWFEYQEELYGGTWEYYQNYRIDVGSFAIVVNPAVAGSLQISNVKKEIYFLETYDGGTNLASPQWVSTPSYIYGMSLVNHTAGDKWYKSSGSVTTRYDGIDPVTWAGWYDGSESYDPDERMVVKLTVELERTDVPAGTAKPIVWSKTFLPEYADAGYDPLRYVRSLCSPYALICDPGSGGGMF